MSNLFLRTYQFTDGTTAYGSQVEVEIGNIVNVLNNLNTATVTWGQVSASHGTNVPLIADCASGSQHIADFKNNNVIKASVDSSGNIDTKGTVTAEATSNQLILGTTRTITLSATQPATSSRTYTLPDKGANSNVMLSSVALVDNARVNAAGYIIGTVVQTNQVIVTSGTTSSGTAYTSTGSTASITPLATTHKIKITAVGTLANTAFSTQNVYVSIFRGSTDLDTSSNGFGLVSTNAANTVDQHPCCIIYLDSPATTSSTIYTLKIKSDTAAKAGWNNNGSAVFLLEEIAF